MNLAEYQNQDNEALQQQLQDIPRQKTISKTNLLVVQASNIKCKFLPHYVTVSITGWH
jgi:hypothetical protein